MSDSQDQDKPKIGTLHLIVSTLAAAIGVQRRENLERDFQASSPYPFIAAGIIFTVVFITTIILVVKWVLAE